MTAKNDMKCDRCGEDATLRCTVCKAQRCWDHACEHFPRCADDFVVEVIGGFEDSCEDNNGDNNSENNNDENNNAAPAGWWNEQNIIASLSNAKLNDARRSYQRLIVLIDQELAARAAGLRSQQAAFAGSFLCPKQTASASKRNNVSPKRSSRRKKQTPEEIVLLALKTGRLTVEKLNEVIKAKQDGQRS